MLHGNEILIYLIYVTGVLLVYLMGRFLVVPVRWAGMLLLNSLAGGLAIILINIFGTPWGIMIPVNPVNAVTVGILGLPGIVALATFFA